MEKETRLSQHSAKPSDQIMTALTQMAILRSTVPDASTLKLYARRLSKEKTEDVLAAIEKLAELPRNEGDAAFPEVGTILSMTGVMRVARHNREKALREYYQQQMCPKCGDTVGMIRPRGEQFRTFCMKCQAYRKILPEDMTLTPGEWTLLCSKLTEDFLQWKAAGAKYNERVDPQVDRELVRGLA